MVGLETFLVSLIDHMGPHTTKKALLTKFPLTDPKLTGLKGVIMEKMGFVIV